jgi:hypothetical protein
LIVGYDHAVDEKLGQLPPLSEGGGGQPVSDGLAERFDPVGDGGKLQPLRGGGVQLALLGLERGAAAIQFVALVPEFVQPDHLGQVGIQQPLQLVVQLAQGPADDRLPGLEFLGQPGTALCSLQRAADLGGVGQQRAQVGPDQLVELPGGNVAGSAALSVRRAEQVGAPAAQVVVVAAPGSGGPSTTGGRSRS